MSRAKLIPSSVRALPANTDWRPFLDGLIADDEIDPKYTGLVRSGLPDDQRKRIAFAYVAFYHTGFAGWLSQYRGEKFWAAVEANYTTAPRGSQRRHFRGALGRTALAAWRERWPHPESMMDELIDQPHDYLNIREWAKKSPQLGSYFIWKLNDLCEVVGGDGSASDFAEAAPFVHDSPRKGAKMIDAFRTHWETFSLMRTYAATKGFTAPPYSQRPFDWQEAETVCCYMKHLRKGHYARGKHTAQDLTEVRRIRCEANEAMAHGMLLCSKLTPRYVADVARFFNLNHDTFVPEKP